MGRVSDHWPVGASPGGSLSYLNRLSVTLKVLPAGTLADEAARKRFRKEALTRSADLL